MTAVILLVRGVSGSLRLGRIKWVVLNEYNLHIVDAVIVMVTNTSSIYFT